jgi:hypothetical protein
MGSRGASVIGHNEDNGNPLPKLGGTAGDLSPQEARGSCLSPRRFDESRF